MNDKQIFESICEPFHSLFDQLDEGVMMIDKTEVVYANEMISKILGINRHSILTNIFALFPEELYGDFASKISCYKSSDSLSTIVNSSYLKVNLDIKLSRFEFNKIIYTSVIFKVLEKPQNILDFNDAFSYDFFPFIFLETNELGRIVKYNKQFTNQLQYTDNDIKIGLHIIEITENIDKIYMESIFTNHDYTDFRERKELKLRKKNGVYVNVQMHCQAKSENNLFDGFIFLFVDNTEIKTLEIKFQQNQKRLRNVLDLVPHMIFLKDSEGKILLANKACADFYHTTTKEIVYSNISDFHSNEDECKRIRQEDLEVISTGTMKEWNDLELTDNENNKKIFKATKIPFRDPYNEQVHSLGILVDITQQQLAELETREAKEKFRLLVERGSDGILIMQDNKIVYANRQTARMFGYQLEEFLQKPLSSLVHRNQLKKTFDEYKQNSQNKDVGNHYELKIVKPSGGFGYVEAKVSTINYLGVKSRLIFLRDITKRKLAEKDSQRFKNMLEQAQKIAKLGSWELNLQQDTFYCSDEIFNILDVKNDETIQRNPSWMVQFIPHNEKKAIFKGLIASIDTGKKYEIEFPVVSLNGTRKIIHSQSQVFNDSKGKPERIIGTWLDISEQIRLEQVLKEAKLKAEESDNLKSAFLANMSHEIRTPMNAILGFANLLKNRNIDNATHFEYIDHILQSGEGLIKLINDIIDISKIESNQLVIEKSPVKINEVLDQIYSRYEELLLIEDNHAISLELEKAFPDPDFTLLLDSYRLQQVISYLLTNAIKFAPKGIISFGYNIMNSELIFHVKDQGIGIPANKKDLIFKSFGKLDEPQQLNKSGTGLGLSISKSLVNLMGGRIWFETAENVGTKFFFTLPLVFSKQKTTIKRESFSSYTQEIELSGKIILIAEDELLNYKLLETLLKRTGAEILWAKNGIEAVNIVSSRKVDLIFMDIKMPEMNGYEATKAIKLINPGIPSIAQTAFAFSNEQQYILQSGCDMYLTKPIKHLEVYKALNTYLV